MPNAVTCSYATACSLSTKTVFQNLPSQIPFESNLCFSYICEKTFCYGSKLFSYFTWNHCYKSVIRQVNLLRNLKISVKMLILFTGPISELKFQRLWKVSGVPKVAQIQEEN